MAIHRPATLLFEGFVPTAMLGPFGGFARLSRTVKCARLNLLIIVASLLSFLPTALTQSCTVQSVHTAAQFSCVMYSGGRLRCWGENPADTGSSACFLGIGDSTARGIDAATMGAALPFIDAVASDGVTGVQQVSLGYYGVCFLATPTSTSITELRCWGTGTTTWNLIGYNGGQTGASLGCSPSDMGTNLAPIPVPSGCSVVQIVLTSFNGVILCSDSVTVYVWGTGGAGQLGTGTSANRGGSANWGASWPAVDLGGVTIAKVVDNNGGGSAASHLCILTTSGGMKCWGRNEKGQLGVGDFANRGDHSNEMGSNLPLIVFPGGRTVQDACMGTRHTVVFYDNNAVEVFGEALFEQLGTETGTGAHKNAPTGTGVDLSSGLASQTVGSIYCGLLHTCALSVNKEKLTCWGFNSQGALGLGDYTSRGANVGDMASLSPIQIGSPAITTIEDVALGAGHNCVISQASDVYCWGRNDKGELGLGGTAHQPSPSTLSPVNLACPTPPPTTGPSASPTSSSPTISPTSSLPTKSPTTSRPTLPPTKHPVTSAPSAHPTIFPSRNPTDSPSQSPLIPSGSPSRGPSIPAGQPSISPTFFPTRAPSVSPTTSSPSKSPTTSVPTQSPSTSLPTRVPTMSPSTSAPTRSPITSAPTLSPSTPAPTQSPTTKPTISPSTSPTRHVCVLNANSFTYPDGYTRTDLVRWQDCVGKSHLDECLPSCSDGFRANGNPATVYCPNLDGSDAKVNLTVYDCLPNSCSQGANLTMTLASSSTAVQAEIITSVDNCKGSVSGATCTPQCPVGYVSEPFELICGDDNLFQLARNPCLANSCNAGPLNGTGTENGDYQCLSLTSGQQCAATCLDGYSPSGQVSLVCDSQGRFNASGATCVPNTCEDGPYFGVDQRMNYTACAVLRTGQSCVPECEDGYHASASLRMTCFILSTGNTTRYMFDASDVECRVNICGGGAAAGVQNAIDVSPCNSLSTGEVCNASNVTCEQGYEATGTQTMVCVAASPAEWMNGTYSAAGLQCNAIPSDCSGGPEPSTRSNNTVYSSCDAKQTGQLCEPVCQVGYQHKNATNFTLQCDSQTHRYNASAVICAPNPCTEGQLFGRDSHADYSACDSKKSGEVCKPQCEIGYTLVQQGANDTESSGFELVCREFHDENETNNFYLYDAQQALCVVNRCGGGPRVSPHNALRTSMCNDLVTGQVCKNINCEAGYRAMGEQAVVCTGDLVNGTYSIQGLACAEVPSDCDGGPESGTGSNNTDYSGCNGMESLQTCEPQCEKGYRHENATNFTLVCDPLTGRYNASAVRCTPNNCTEGQLFGRDSRADYSACNSMVSGRNCKPPVDSGYTLVDTAHANKSNTNESSGLELVCLEFKDETPTSGTNRFYLYDAQSVKSWPNLCGGGANAASVQVHVSNTSACNSLKTGDLCTAAHVSCDKGYEAVGEQVMECVGGLQEGTYDASQLSCVEKRCNATQYVNNNACVGCVGGMVAAVDNASAAGVDTVCKEPLAL
eukprot:Hpha_TRINITY_DN16008_c3_g9::TRINITY_DN16008_c3_g9_i1::g.120528::m.120528